MRSAAENLALQIVQRLQTGGHVAYWAGGCVRDRLMGRSPSDYDVATSARPEEVLRLFPRSQKVGVAFGVVLVREKESQIEVATFRTDGDYSDGRHPDSVTFADAKTDAQRRDFSCNGLFFDPVAQQLHDFVGGQMDIQGRLLRAIGDPRQRFAEDHLRMLRAIRFAAKLGFSIEPATFAAVQALSEKITTVSRERIHDELEMILAHPARAAAAQLLQSSHMLKQLWPRELFESPDEPRQWPVLSRLPAEADAVVALAAMHEDMGASNLTGSSAAELLRAAFLLSNAETTDFAWLVEKRRALDQWRAASKAPLKRLIADSRWPRLAMLFEASVVDEAAFKGFRNRIATLNAEGASPPPFITGDVLISLGAAPGPTFRRWLESLYDRQLEGEFPDAEAALAAARKLIEARP